MYDVDVDVMLVGAETELRRTQMRSQAPSQEHTQKIPRLCNVKLG